MSITDKVAKEIESICERTGADLVAMYGSATISIEIMDFFAFLSFSVKELDHEINKDIESTDLEDHRYEWELEHLRKEVLYEFWSKSCEKNLKITFKDERECLA